LRPPRHLDPGSGVISTRHRIVIKQVIAKCTKSESDQKQEGTENGQSFCFSVDICHSFRGRWRTILGHLPFCGLSRQRRAQKGGCPDVLPLCRPTPAFAAGLDRSGNLSDNMRWLNFVCICDKVIIIFLRFFLRP